MADGDGDTGGTGGDNQGQGGTGGTGGTGAPPENDGKGGTGGSGGQGGQAGEPPKGAEPKFTQEQLDAIISKRLAEEQGRHQAALKLAQDTAGKSDADRLKIEKEAAEKDRDDVTSGAARSVAEARVEAAMAGAGVKSERLAAVARLVDLDEVAKSDDVRKAAADAVAKAKADYPEFFRGTAAGASGGDLGGGGQPAAVTQEQFDKMEYDARAELFRKDPARYRVLAGTAAAAS